MAQLDAQEIIDYIGNAPKKTPVKVYIKGNLADLNVPDSIKAFIETKTGVLFGDWSDVKTFLDQHQAEITDTEIENQTRNSAVPLLDMKELTLELSQVPLSAIKF
jgi:Tetrahydrodipicolinate succinyltransferase N-terminal.